MGPSGEFFLELLWEITFSDHYGGWEGGRQVMIVSELTKYGDNLQVFKNEYQGVLQFGKVCQPHGLVTRLFYFISVNKTSARITRGWCRYTDFRYVVGAYDAKSPVMVGSQDPRIPYIWDPIGSGGSQRSEGSDLGFGVFRIRIQDPDHTANTSDSGSTDPDLN